MSRILEAIEKSRQLNIQKMEELGKPPVYMENAVVATSEWLQRQFQPWLPLIIVSIFFILMMILD